MKAPGLAATLLPLALLAGCGGGSNSFGGGSQNNTSISLSASSLTFASTVLGVAAPPQVVTVTSSGSTTLQTPTITGANASQFAVSSNCPATLANQQTCGLTVTYTPSTAGAASATLSVPSSGVGSPQTVTLAGTGATPAPVVSIMPATLALGNAVLGGAPVSGTITVSNTGNAPLTFTSIALANASAGLTLGGTCAVTAAVAPNASCTTIVSFAPAAAGTVSGSVVFTDNAAGSPQSVTLTGAAYPNLSFKASALAGTSPLVGASVMLYAAGTTGNGAGSASLISAALTTDANGNVTIPSQFNCPSSNAQVYLVARGGTVGGSAANSNIVLLSAVGTCAQITPGQTVVINEVTTVAAAYALNQFYGTGGVIGASATNTAGLANAFATAAELANPATGTSPGATLPGNASNPAARINLLANLLNRCVASSTACSGLYTSATASGATAPANTLDLAAAIVQHPANNVPALYTAASASSAFMPSLKAQPTDFTLFLTIMGGGMSSPSGIGVDSTGAVWVANYFNVASKFTTLGAPVFPGGITGAGLNNSYGLAVDLKDNAWIPNEQPYTGVGTGTVSELSPSGATLAGNGYTAGGLNYPIAVAIDTNSTAWVVDYGNSHVTLLSQNGTPLSGTSGYTTPLFAFPVAVAIDGNHFGWIANQSSTMVTKVAPDGSTFTNYDCCNGSSGLAIDQANNVWVANFYGSSVSLISAAGQVVSNGYTGLGSLNHPQGIALDGAGNVFVANFRAPYLTVLTGAGANAGQSISPAAGLGADASLLEAYALALDASGNVWVTNFGNDTVTKFIGLAVPVKTPLSGLPQKP